MGYTRHGKQDGVERFMRHFFLNAREIARLTRIMEPAIMRAAMGPPAIAATLAVYLGAWSVPVGLYAWLYR